MMTKHAETTRFLCLVAALLVAFGCVSGSRGRKAALDGLQEDLYSGDPRRSDQAALVLLATGSDAGFAVARKALADTSPAATRAAVLYAFTVQKDPRIQEQALRCLGDEDANVVQLAQKYLEEIIGPAAAPQLLAVARDVRRGSRERVAAVTVLESVGADDSVARDSVEGLLDLLRDTDTSISAAVAQALQEITYQSFGAEYDVWSQWWKQSRGMKVGDWRRVGRETYDRRRQYETEILTLRDNLLARDQELFDAYKAVVDMAAGAKVDGAQVVMDVLKNAKPVRAQVYAAQQLGKMQAAEAVPLLVEKASGLDADLVKACVDALGAIGDAAGVDVVALNLGSSDSAVRLSAVEAYALLSQDLSRLLPLQSDASVEVKAAVARAIGARHWQQGYGALEKMLDDESPDVRVAAAKALGILGDKAAVPALVRLGKDTNSRVRWTVARSLSQLADPSSFDALIELSMDSASEVREPAVDGLARLGDKRAVDRLLVIVQSDSSTSVVELAASALVELVRGDDKVLLSVAGKLQEMGKFNRAESMLKLLADVIPGDATQERKDAIMEARRRLAGVYLQAGTYKSAERYYELILNERPNDAQALEGVGQAYKGLGDWQALARRYGRHIVAGEAGDAMKKDFLDALGNMVAGQQYAGAVETAEQVVNVGVSSDSEFEAAVRDRYSRALQLYMESLVSALADGADGGASAKNVLKTPRYGKAAAPALVAGLSSVSQPTRIACLEILSSMAGGRDFGFDPRKDAVDQQASIDQWHAWLEAPQTQ